MRTKPSGIPLRHVVLRNFIILTSYQPHHTPLTQCGHSDRNLYPYRRQWHDSHDVKTLQYQKMHERMYERRKHELQKSGLDRSGTQHTMDSGITQSAYGGGSGIDLATAVIALKEVDVGEEPFRGSWYGIDDGNILLSSHLDDPPPSEPSK
ncbi:hypothetical protein B0O80DRAFT_523819 [Mortierella sp. GBAus27b]|nr:hypothetical protein B0O80DRAFT_523819 [Mortierella sp. GBAus27b]